MPLANGAHWNDLDVRSIVQVINNSFLQFIAVCKPFRDLDVRTFATLQCECGGSKASATTGNNNLETWQNRKDVKY